MTYVDPTAIQIIRAYAKETNQSVYDILADAFSTLDKAIFDKATEINKLRQEAVVKNLKEDNAERLEQLIGQFY